MESSKVLYEMATQMREITFNTELNPVFACRDLIKSFFEMATEEEKKTMIESLVKYDEAELFKKMLEGE